MTEKSNLEKHIQTIIQGGISLAIVWVIATTQNTSEEVGKISVEIKYLRETLQSMKDDTAKSAEREHANLQKQLDDLKRRVDRAEGR